MRTACFGLVALAFLSGLAASGQEIRWATSYDEALAECKDRGALLLCVLTMSNEEDNEAMMKIWGSSREVARAAQGFVCCFANHGDHREISRELDGKTVSVCPVLKTIPCAAHREMERVLIRNPNYQNVFYAAGDIKTPVAWLADADQKVLEIIANGDKSTGFGAMEEAVLVSQLKAAARKYGAGLSSEQYHKAKRTLEEGRALEEKGDLGAAAQKYHEVVEAAPERVSLHRLAKDRLAVIGEKATGKLAEAEELVARKEYGPAMALLEDLARNYRYTPAEAKAKAMLDDLRKLPAVRKIVSEQHARIEAEKMLADARKLERSKKWVKALEAYRACAKAHPDTEAGQAAEKRMAEIEADEKIMGEVREAAAKKDCTKWLNLARNFIRANLPDPARKELERVLEKYPGTSYAETAKKMLAELK